MCGGDEDDESVGCAGGGGGCKSSRSRRTEANEREKVPEFLHQQNGN